LLRKDDSIEGREGEEGDDDDDDVVLFPFSVF
jgi:hypothetical protein